ncbi:MAG TPA: alanine racemase [Steroidobacteraceae bacterium]|nr:alanine racemase [Steroidobacteraceae bacterium]
MSRLIRAVIDTQALRHNLNVIRVRAGRARVIAVVKANAYGHGLVGTALSLHGADAYAVARLEEGMALRAAGVNKRIVLLEGVFTPAQLEDAAHERLDLVVHDLSQVELLEKARNADLFALWLKVDTGMHRLGFAPRDFAAALTRIRSLLPRPRELRLMTHLACANERDERTTAEQLTRFREVTRGLDCETSIANSAGVFGEYAPGCQWVRPGIALYGGSPFVDVSAAQLGLKPVMTLMSSVIAVRRVPRGESVGYGAAWTAPRDSVVAVVAAGYGDGVHRSMANGAPVLVNEQRAALVGRVSMDMLAADVTGLNGVQVGVPAVLWGAGLPVDEVARHAGTIAYELLCSVSQRVPLEPR